LSLCWGRRVDCWKAYRWQNQELPTSKRQA
jgi:hypothetical protein